MECPGCHKVRPDPPPGRYRCTDCGVVFDVGRTWESSEVPIEYHTFWRRVGAGFVDGLVFLPLSLLTTAAILSSQSGF